MEKRLKKRYNTLVRSEMGVKENNKSGMNFLVKTKAFSQAQASWRFYNNKNVKISDLNNPILKDGIEQINKQCKEYCLVAYDWSHIDYKRHKSKKDCIEERRSKTTTAKSIGYDLQSSLAISDKDGTPITPLLQNLKTSNKVYSTYDDNIDIECRHLEELSYRSKYTNENLNIKKKIVDIVDREADSIALIRNYHKDKRLYLIRAKDGSTIHINYSSLNDKDKKQLEKINTPNKAIEQKQLASSLSKGKYVKAIRYKKQAVKIYVNECEVTITRDAYRTIVGENGKRKNIKTKGVPITTRFVVVKLINKKQEILATWILLTNVEKEIDSKTIATWYYYRWNIESYFKLLKSSGFNLEKWQEETPLAIFKRLLVVSYACVLVWQIQHSTKKYAKETREFLTKLSGKLIQRDKETTAPALLAGLLNFLQTLDILENFSIDELFDMKSKIEELFGFEI